MTLREAMRYAAEKKVPKKEAKKLIRFFTGVDESDIIIHYDDYVLRDYEIVSFVEGCIELKYGMPLQYITQMQNFYNSRFYVNEHVLIPQPDTEILVSETVEEIKRRITEQPDMQSRIKVLELCTGCGAISICLKKQFGDLIEVTATDICQEAIDLASKNMKYILHDTKAIKFLRRNLFSGIWKKYDIILANPPYIPTDEISKLPIDVQYEPRIALDGGPDGLDFYRRIRTDVQNHMNSGATVLLEIGYNQREAVSNIFNGAKCVKDFADKDRVIIWRG